MLDEVVEEEEGKSSDRNWECVLLVPCVTLFLLVYNRLSLRFLSFVVWWDRPPVRFDSFLMRRTKWFDCGAMLWTESCWRRAAGTWNRHHLLFILPHCEYVTCFCWRRYLLAGGGADGQLVRMDEYNRWWRSAVRSDRNGSLFYESFSSSGQKSFSNRRAFSSRRRRRHFLLFWFRPIALWPRIGAARNRHWRRKRPLRRLVTDSNASASMKTSQRVRFIKKTTGNSGPSDTRSQSLLPWERRRPAPSSSCYSSSLYCFAYSSQRQALIQLNRVLRQDVKKQDKEGKEWKEFDEKKEEKKE